jgi:ubiquinone/menaquinone biosynthesis C-methylase UbiE
MIERVLEPEVMDEPEQARAYAEADFAEVNAGFVTRCLDHFGSTAPSRVVDLGCGPADIPLRLARALPETRVCAVDAAANMLALGARALAATDLAARVWLLHGKLPGLAVADRSFDAVISNSLLHHLPDPQVLWSELPRLARPGSPVVVCDLFRPPSREAAQRIVDEADCSDHPVLQHDFFHSLLAAFTVSEVRSQLDRAGLTGLRVEQVSERHLVVLGHLPG